MLKFQQTRWQIRASRMAKRRSLFKWTVIACIAFMVPAVALFVVVYLILRTKAAKRAFGFVKAKACISQVRTFLTARKLRACHPLKEDLVEVKYYRADDAPFVAIVDGQSVICVSAVSIGEVDAKIVEGVYRAMENASMGASEMAFFVKASRRGFEGKILVAENSDGTAEGIAVAGALAWRFARSLLAVIESHSPGAALRICAGEEVVRNLALGGAT